MNLDFVRQRRFEPIIQRYDARDSALYALNPESARTRSTRTNRPSSMRATDRARFPANA